MLQEATTDFRMQSSYERATEVNEYLLYTIQISMQMQTLVILISVLHTYGLQDLA